MGDDFVLDAVRVLEKDRVVARRSVLRIKARWRDYLRAQRFQLVMQPVDFGTRAGKKSEVVKRTRFSTVHMIIAEGGSRRCDRKAQSWMAVLNDMEIVLLYRCAGLGVRAKP